MSTKTVKKGNFEPPFRYREQWEHREQSKEVKRLKSRLDKTLQTDVLIGSAAMDLPKLFDNLPKLMRPEQIAELFGYSVATIYDWRYRGKLRGVPDGLFLSLNRRLYIRTDFFLNWIASQNPNLELGD